MAMAFALVGLRAPGVTIENPGCVSKTFPDYFIFFINYALRSTQYGMRIPIAYHSLSGGLIMIQLGLTGYPLGHSLSPKLHAAAF